MPKYLTQYRVFIGSPSDLDAERKVFRDRLEQYTKREAEPRGVTFFPVGWEDTIGGVGRPQKLINEDLKHCDYAVFVLHDRWGSPTGSGHSSGIEEEWESAEQLYKEIKIRNIALFFKEIVPAQLNDPGPQLAKVTAINRKIESGKEYLFKPYAETGDFGEKLEQYLASWLRDHEKSTANTPASGGLITSTPPDVPTSVTTAVSEPSGPDFNFWITEANQLTDAGMPDNFAALFCAKKAEATAGSDIEWGRAKNSLGAAQFRLNNLNEALAAFREIGNRFNSASEVDKQIRLATALLNEGLTLVRLGRKEEGVAVLDDVVTRFGSATELTMRERVGDSLLNKGVVLSQLGRNEEAITTLDDVITRLGSAPDLPPLREQVAKTLFNKGVALGQIGRNEEAIAIYDEIIARFSSAPELPLREQVAKAILNKGAALGQLGRGEESFALYDDVIARFGYATEMSVLEAVAMAQLNKGAALGRLGRKEEAIAIYDEIIARFGSTTELPLSEIVKQALDQKKRQETLLKK